MTEPGSDADVDWPVVSVVFLAYNRRVELAVSLEHVLERLDYPEDRLEVIVVDNASTDGTAAMVRSRFASAQLVRNPENLGMSGVNVGVSTATGEWLVVLDDDCYLTGDALKVAVRAARGYQADLVSFTVEQALPDNFWVPGLLAFWGCAAMFSRRAVEAEPFYDPNIFVWGNEIELTARLLDRGLRHLYLPEVAAVHLKEPPPSTWQLWPARMLGRNLAYDAAKLLQPGDAVAVLARLIVRTLLNAYLLDPRSLQVLPDVFRGLLAGARGRRPVRAEVSAAYRQACSDFASPLALMRGPLQRLRGHGRPATADLAREERRLAHDKRVAQFYPRGRALLEF